MESGFGQTEHADGFQSIQRVSMESSCVILPRRVLAICFSQMAHLMAKQIVDKHQKKKISIFPSTPLPKRRKHIDFGEVADCFCMGFYSICSSLLCLMGPSSIRVKIWGAVQIQPWQRWGLCLGLYVWIREGWFGF